MKKNNFVFILILFIINSCSTESYEEQNIRTIEDWGKEYKWFTKQTNSYNSDYGKSIAIDSKGNIFFLGHTGGGVGTKDLFYGNKIYDSDIFIIKYNLYFEKEWVKTISASSSEGANAENAVDIEIDSNDNLIILGHGTGYFDNSTGGGDKAFLLNYNNNGDKILAKQTDLSISAGYGKISLEIDNNIYFLSKTKLIKYNTNYETQWEINF